MKYLGEITNNKDLVTKEYVDGMSGGKVYTATVNTSWTAANGYVYKDITITGLKSTDTPTIDVICSTGNYENEQAEWGKVFKGTTYANKLRLYAKKATAINLSIQIKV